MPRHEQMPTVEVTNEADRVCIAVTGELDAESAPGLGYRLDGLLAPAWPDAILDLAELDFMDSSGLSLLINLSRRMTDNHATLSLRNVSPSVRRVFEVTGVGARFQGDVEDLAPQ
jgi:anti-sigma B factor antagonist